jgi:cell fate regulator YaaT (PSP1 superfamily)
MSNPLPVFQPMAAPGGDHLIEVAFKGNRRGFFLTADDALREGDYVLVEAERGMDLGRVRSLGGVARSKCSASNADASARILRTAEPEEVRQYIVLRADEDRVRRQTRELVDKHDLRMKVSDAEWQWDRNKLTIYFTAERRVDFRELVRDLARTFRTRIELKQIGVRDEAAMLGGLGRCGRQLCCATWLREIRPVSLQLAKDQNLSLNPSQISGTCGRLMCCLTYEHDAYVQARKRFPREGKVLQTAQGMERVIGIDIWRESLTLMDEARQRRVVTLADLKKEIAAGGSAPREQAPRAEQPEPDEPAQRQDRERGRNRPPREPRAKAGTVSNEPGNAEQDQASGSGAAPAAPRRTGARTERNRPRGAAPAAEPQGKHVPEPEAAPKPEAESPAGKPDRRQRRKRGRRSPGGQGG